MSSKIFLVFVLCSLPLSAFAIVTQPNGMTMSDESIIAFFSQHECAWKSSTDTNWHALRAREVSNHVSTYGIVTYYLQAAMAEPRGADASNYEAIGYFGISTETLSVTDWAALTTFKVPRGGLRGFQTTIRHYYDNKTYTLKCNR